MFSNEFWALLKHASSFPVATKVMPNPETAVSRYFQLWAASWETNFT